MKNKIITLLIILISVFTFSLIKVNAAEICYGLLEFTDGSSANNNPGCYSSVNSSNVGSTLFSSGGTNRFRGITVGSENRYAFCLEEGKASPPKGTSYTKYTTGVNTTGLSCTVTNYINTHNYTDGSAGSKLLTTTPTTGVGHYNKFRAIQDNVIWAKGCTGMSSGNTVNTSYISELNSACFSKFTENCPSNTLTVNAGTIDYSGDYVIVPFTITKSHTYLSYTIATSGINGATVTDNSGNTISGKTTATSFKVKVLKSSITSSQTLTVNLSGSYTKATLDFYIATNGQTASVGPIQTLTDYKETTQNISGTKSVTLQPQTGKIEVKKTDSATNAALAGAKFLIYTDSGCHTVATNNNGTAFTEATTNANGLVTFSNLKVGTYYIKETSAPTNYLKSTECKIGKVTAGNTTSINISNSPLGEIVIKKIDKKTNQALSGVEFELYKLEANDWKLVTDQEKDKLGNSIVKKVRINGEDKYLLCSTNGCNSTGTDSNGQIVINNLLYGTYGIKEIENNKQGNQGYKIISDIKRITLSSGSTCPTYRPNAITNKEALACAEILIENEPIEIKIVKLGLNKNGLIPQTPIKLTGATFSITADESTGIWDDIVINKDTGNVIGIKPGDYTIKEIIPPKGYSAVYQYVKIRIDANGNITVITEDDLVKAYNTGEITGLGVVANIPELDFYNKQANLLISKQDIANSKELPGATLKVTCENGFEETWISSNTPKEFYIEPEVTCKLRETIAPNGYELELNDLEFIIDENNNVKSLTNLKADSNYKVEANRIVIYNGLEVPDTASFISQISIIAGISLIGIGSYFIFKKIKEQQN